MQKYRDLHKDRKNQFRTGKVAVIGGVQKGNRLIRKDDKIITSSRQAFVNGTNRVMHMEKKRNPQ